MEIVRNTEAIFDLANAIEADPEHYSQTSWFSEDTTVIDAGRGGHFCGGGSACVAGWAVIRAGLLDKQRKFKEDFQIRPGLLHRAIYSGNAIRQSDKAGYNSQWAGATVLGLTWGESQVLFDEYWRPPSHMTVPDALRAFALGESLLNLTDWKFMCWANVEVDEADEYSWNDIPDDVVENDEYIRTLKADLTRLHDPTHYDRDGNIITPGL